LTLALGMTPGILRESGGLCNLYCCMWEQNPVLIRLYYQETVTSQYTLSQKRERRTEVKKAIWIVFGLILIAGIAVGAVAAAGGGGDTIYADTSYSGKEVEISIGESLVVTLPSNTSTGYSWTLAENSDEGVLQEVEHEYIATQTNLVGAAGKELWTFKALQDGTSTIRLEYIRPWEAGALPAETFTLTVVVD